MTDARVYVIWSFEHQAWWAPDRRGYTEMLDQAGRYGEAEAQQIVRDANVGCRSAASAGTTDLISVNSMPGCMATIRRSSAPDSHGHERRYENTPNIGGDHRVRNAEVTSSSLVPSTNQNPK